MSQLVAATQDANGNIDYGRLGKLWNGLAPSQKTALFGAQDSARISRLVKDAETLTFTNRYQPPTGASLPVLAPGMEMAVSNVAGMVPGGRAAVALLGQGADQAKALAHFNLRPPVASAPTRATRGLEAGMIAGQTAPASGRTSKEQIERAKRLQRMGVQQ